MFAVLLAAPSVFADTLVGLRCSNQYVSHEVNSRNNIDRVDVVNSLMGISSFSENMLLPIGGGMKNFSDSMVTPTGKFEITFHVFVGAEISLLRFEVRSSDQHVDLPAVMFNTKEGLTYTQSLMGMAKEVENKKNYTEFTHSIVSCNPVFSK